MQYLNCNTGIAIGLLGEQYRNRVLQGLVTMNIG